MTLFLLFVASLFVSVLLLIYGLWRGVKIFIIKEEVEHQPPVLFEILDRDQADKIIPNSVRGDKTETTRLKTLRPGQGGMV